jgi:hypothetical protein
MPLGCGNETLNGNAGADMLLGGAGNDTLNGGTGNDIVSGGTGADVSVRRDRRANKDSIVDYSFVEGDTLDLSALLDAAFGAGQPVSGLVRAVQSGSDVIVQDDTKAAQQLHRCGGIDELRHQRRGYRQSYLRRNRSHIAERLNRGAPRVHRKSIPWGG